MSELPSRLVSSKLWKKLSENLKLQVAITSLRDVVEILASKISEQLPEFTDHSIKHFDSLWWVVDEIVTEDEFSTMTVGEAFVLAGGIYLHDIGMALGATQEGAEELKSSSAYLDNQQRLLNKNVSPDVANLMSLRHAARILHAKTAEQFATKKVPGLDRYLLEDTDIRGHWGTMIGQVAASHHWSLPEVWSAFGVRGRIPDVLGEEVDLAYVACVLRVVDYAHVNHERASSLERSLRQNMPIDSAIHWDAQQYITGPRRSGNQLVYGSTKGIESVNGWWTFYEMAKGLDAEITNVAEFLASRSSSSLRFSLEGVKGVRSSLTFSSLVMTAGFEPVDIRFKSDSMNRLVELLGGRTLYGNDFFAPIRELLQNAVDALLINQIELEKAGIPCDDVWIKVALEQKDKAFYLSVSDNGVGMSSQVISKYLLGIAADYWNSPDYFSDHPDAVRSCFKPIGRFGIGFLSVFMLGDEVEVSTQRRGGENLRLRLQGIGQRGALERLSAGYLNGTSVRIRIKPELTEGLLRNLKKIILRKAPMLPVPIYLSTPQGESKILPGWWKSVSQDDLAAFVADDLLSKLGTDKKWFGSQPEAVTDSARVVAVPSTSTTVICSKGFSIASHGFKGMFGIIDIGEQALNAERSQLLEWGAKEHRSELLQLLKPSLINSLNNLVAEGDVPGRYEFIIGVVKCYGIDLLFETLLPWITIRYAPGNAVLVSWEQFVNESKDRNEVFIVYGATPWEAEQIARKMFSHADANALVVPVSSISQPEVGNYDERDEIVEGDLAEHFEAGKKYTSGDPKDAILLQASIMALSKAWGNSLESFDIKWRRYNRILCGHAIRGTNVQSGRANS